MNKKVSSAIGATAVTSRVLTPKDQLVLQFEPGTSVQDVKEWVNYFLNQAQVSNRQITITADSMHVGADGTVIVSGKNIGQAASGAATAGGGKQNRSARGGEVMNGVDTFSAPRPPRPKLPSPEELNQIMAKSVGQAIPLLNLTKTLGSGKIGGK